MKIHKSKRLWIIITVVICAILAAAAYSMMGKGVSAETAAVTKGEIKQYLEDTANVQCVQKQTVYVDNSGKISAINVDIGQSVTKGNLLLTMENGDLELQLKDADAKVAAARAQLQGTVLENFAKEIEIAKVNLEQVQITYGAAYRAFQDTKVLFEAGAISQDEYNQAEDANDSAAAAVKTAELQLADVQAGTPNYLKNTYMSQLEQAVIYRDTIKRNLDKQQLAAPIDGIVLEKYVSENTPVVSGTAAFLIGNAKKLELTANILSDDSYKVKLDQSVEISGKAINNKILIGKVIKIAPMAQTITSTLGVNQKRVPVTIEIIGDTSMLKPGFNVDIKIITADKKDTLVVPDTAVFDYKDTPCIFIVENGKAVLKPVTKGLESDKQIEIQSGLTASDIILVSPDSTIKEGIKIKPALSKTN